MTFDQFIAGLMLLAGGYLFGTARWKFTAWNFARQVVRQRDALMRERDTLVRKRCDERTRSLYWLTVERNKRRDLEFYAVEMERELHSYREETTEKERVWKWN